MPPVAIEELALGAGDRCGPSLIAGRRHASEHQREQGQAAAQ
jgi:hypothetical protein